MVTGQMVAVKRIKIDGLKDEERDMLMQEVDLLKSLTHPSIVKYEGFIKTDEYLNIVLEFVENGSLLTTLKAFGTFPEKLVVIYVVKILEGLIYLHGKQVGAVLPRFLTYRGVPFTPFCLYTDLQMLVAWFDVGRPL